jgi:hypothetical protein
MLKSMFVAPAITVLTLGALVATSAAQQGLHFVGTPTVTATKTSTSAFLTATGEVAGAGRTATATLSATAEVTRGCITRGGGEPGGLERTAEVTTGSQTFNTRQGRGTFSVSTNPVTVAGFECPSRNMTPVLVSVTFTDIVLTVTSQTGTISQSFADIDP